MAQTIYKKFTDKHLNSGGSNKAPSAADNGKPAESSNSSSTSSLSGAKLNARLLEAWEILSRADFQKIFATRVNS